jgi:hypothetical protein
VVTVDDFLRIKPKIRNFAKNIYINFNVIAIEMKIHVYEV